MYRDDDDTLEFAYYCMAEYGEEYDDKGNKLPNRKVAGEPPRCDKGFHSPDEKHRDGDSGFEWW